MANMLLIAAAVVLWDLDLRCVLAWTPGPSKTCPKDLAGEVCGATAGKDAETKLTASHCRFPTKMSQNKACSGASPKRKSPSFAMWKGVTKQGQGSMRQLDAQPSVLNLAFRVQ